MIPVERHLEFVRYHLKCYLLELTLCSCTHSLMSLLMLEAQSGAASNRTPFAAHHADPIHSRDSPLSVIQAMIEFS